jgi:hypothetical protein
MSLPAFQEDTCRLFSTARWAKSSDHAPKKRAPIPFRESGQPNSSYGCAFLGGDRFARRNGRCLSGNRDAQFVA